METEDANQDEQNEPSTPMAPSWCRLPRVCTPDAEDTDQNVDQPEPNVCTHDYLLLSCLFVWSFLRVHRSDLIWVHDYHPAVRSVQVEKYCNNYNHVCHTRVPQHRPVQ